MYRQSEKNCWTVIPPHISHSMVTAEICSLVWGTLSKFNRFRVLASLLHRRPSTEINQTLHNVGPSPGLIHYIYTNGRACPLTEFWQVQNSLCVQILRSPMLAVVLHAMSSGRQPYFAAFSRECHLYSAGRPSRCTSAHILVFAVFLSYVRAELLFISL